MAGGLLAAFATCLPVAGAEEPPVDDPPAVHIADGSLQGERSDGTIIFEGIPYAAPPLGELRWRAPRAPQSWTGIRDATRPGPKCLQPDPSQPGGAAGSEDCLYLNVQAPDDRSEPLPVMVFLHGGGFLVGSGAEHDATRLVDQGDVVVVTVNYRLGPLGFLDHPALDDPAAGNYALADQQAALRWVRRNIGAFGGDPANVTLWGQSAGAFGTCAQFAAPSARGLFDKAIVQSGPCGATMLTRPKAQARALAYAEVAGCAGSSAAACLRGLPGQALIAATRLGGTLPAKLTDLAWTPVVGTSLLPRQPLEAIRAGAADGIPLVQGGTREEMRSFVAGSYAANPLTAERYPDAVREIYGEADAAAILARYRPEQYATPGVALATVLTDDGSLMGTCRQLSANDAITTKTVFAYEFAQPSGRSIGDFPLGAYHSSDVRYLLDTSNPYAPPPLTPEEEPLGEEMIRHWSTFARSGHPAPGWPHYAHGRGLSFALDNTDVVDLGREHLCGFWRDRVPISDQD